MTPAWEPPSILIWQDIMTPVLPYTLSTNEGPVAIVMGAEDTGVSQENLRICDNMVKIPQFGTIGSLNVSVATSILVYEVVRQRMNEQQ